VITDLEKNVLESIIRLDTLYQKQQGTLIVWSESDTCDLALSFQEKNGCAEIWDKICKIQGKDPSVDVFCKRLMSKY
jgi:protein phosphatase-4 regulatory subunit 3